MSRIGSIWGSGPPVLKALAAQTLSFLFLLGLAYLFSGRLPFWLWVALQALLAASLAAWWGLGPWWRVFQILVPMALGWQLGHTISAWVYPSLLAVIFLVFGGGILTRVPLYNSGSAAWDELLALIPEGERWRIVDLGAGLGGPLAALARRRPDARFIGVEASPLVWFIAWLRCLPWNRNCHIQARSLWNFPLQEIDLAFAFLSPAPMAALWEKTCAEMRPGALLVSHSFQIPGVEPERRIPLPGRPGACLLLYRIPKMP